MKSDQLHYKQVMSITVEEIASAVPMFPTKKAAIAEGKKYGWASAIKMHRRFESVWVVGKKSFQNDEVAGVSMEVFRLPMLRFENGAQPVLRVTRLDQKTR